MARTIQRYGWQRDLPDPRDFKFDASVHAASVVALPASMDLRPICPAIYDQGALGSCTANATSAMLEVVLKKEGATDFLPSRLFIYYNSRAEEGTLSQDSGATLRDALHSVVWKGACHETFMPYDIAKFTVKPTMPAYHDGMLHVATQYMSINPDLTSMKTCLAAGFPFIFGFTVFSSFEGPGIASTGVMPMPNVSTEQVLGGHAVMAVGYDDSKQCMLIRNSWGAGWGIAGHFWMPYTFIADNNYCDDFWTLRKTKG